jgi:hypothetical protein
MNDTHDMNQLRRLILRACLQEPIQLGDLLQLPELKHADRPFIKRIVHACAVAGLLDTWGATSGKYYQTSRAGWVMLTVLESERRTKR